MSGTRNIKDVRDLYDLIDLYANLDQNEDGKLGPGELEAREIAEGDKSDPYEGKPDGYLQPWEVMEMRYPLFNPVETFRIRSANIFSMEDTTDYRAFVDVRRLQRDAEIGGILYKRDTELRFNNNGTVRDGIIARPTEFEEFPGVTFPAGSRVYRFAERERGIQVFPSAEKAIDGMRIPAGSKIEIRQKRIMHIATDGFVEVNGSKFSMIFFHEDGRIKSGDLREDTTLLGANGRMYRFACNERTAFRFDGRVQSGTLAEDTPSPYGTRTIKAGEQIKFLDNGSLRENSLPCLRQSFPTVSFSGYAEPEEIGLVLDAFLAMPERTIASMRALHFTTGELPTPFARAKQRGYANPFDETIYIRRKNSNSPFSATDVAHEAAHMRHFALQKMTLQKIAAATRHLDFTDPEDAMEDHAITEFIFARSFDGRWSRAGRYDFNFTVADLLSYLINFRAHQAKGSKLKTNTPSLGFTCSYGRVSIWEDVATQVERIYGEPRLYRQLINPYSEFYRDKPDQRRYASVYRAKLDLLREYGFITEEKYREIKPLHRDLKVFCQTVNCP